ncbi:hypothetical protein PA598K_05861 [Paenibacillus sp. 598K]|uniref:copper amine oxidase N-terminal domain-containing protein n=1 Tax=Paenibacillus sp. 598K TaxID=1117987 RepID=UPI000FF9FD71|nr:copper amine oxidase N-terminal domain-containing protein [Paenibacillus sp. 598K]GBF77317.1 hypothetical protein PA598K_05861 [Paenibacillus sp. 598K]
MMKKFAALLLTTALSTSLIGSSLASSTIAVEVVVNGKTIPMLVPPVVQNGRALVPVREISQALGYTVNWNQETRTVYLTNRSEVSNAPNPTDEKIVINGNPIATDVPPQVIKGRTMVPVRIISEATGARVEWNQQSRRVTVSSENSLAFPDRLMLNFQPVGLERVEQVQTLPSKWEKKGILSLGRINQSELVLELYEVELGGSPVINGMFTYGNQTFVLNDLSAGTIDEVKNQNLALQFDSGQDRLHLVSAIGAEYETQILVFNSSSRQWSVLRVPGRVATSDSDGILVQFPGKGLSPQAVSLIRFHGSGFEISNLTEAFQNFANSQNIDIQRVTTQYQSMDGQSGITVSLVKDGLTEKQAYTLNGNTLELH